MYKKITMTNKKCKYCNKVHKNNNTGCDNSGDRNTGYKNSGDRNSGYWNSGNWNSGYWNSGYRNSRNRNTGDWNSGDMNSGDMNSGYRNTGNRNTGDWNSGDRNSGAFNTDEPKMRIFNKEIDMTVSEFYEKYNIYADIPLNRWIDITDIENPTEEQQQKGGYLKTLPFKEACQVWWKENPDKHERFLTLPNFDAYIFFEITGIDVREKEEMIEIDGKQVSKDTIKQALKDYFN